MTPGKGSPRLKVVCLGRGRIVPADRASAKPIERMLAIATPEARAGIARPRNRVALKRCH